MANILVVEDDQEVAAAVVLLLELDGHTVRRAEDGLAGLEAIRDQLPDAICLDVDMPRLNGPDFAYRLIVEDSGKERVPVILVSGIADLAQVARNVGTPYFVGKPFSLDALERTLQRALTERRFPQPPPRGEGLGARAGQ